MKKTITKLLCVTLLIALTSETLLADAWCKARKNCKITPKYVAFAAIYFAGGLESGKYGKDKGCGYATKGPFRSYYNGVEVAHAYSWVGDANRNGIVERWSTLYPYSTDAGYFVNTEPTQVEGYSYSSLTSPQVNIGGGGTNGGGIISMQKVDVKLSADANSQFGSIFHVIVWKRNDIVDPATGEVIEDENITAEKILWDASVRIENGRIYTTGGFKEGDFSVTYSDMGINAALTGGQKMLRVMNVSSGERLRNEGMVLDIERDIRQPLRRENPRRVPIEVINDVNTDNIEVYAVASGGYGTYRDIYAPAAAKTDNNMQNNESIAKLNEIVFDNYPQPFSDQTTIQFSVPETQQIVVEVFNINGKRVATLFDAVANKEENYAVDFQASNLPRGLYICRFRGATQVLTRKLLLLY